MKSSKPLFGPSGSQYSPLYIALCVWTMVINMLLIIVNPVAGLFVVALIYLFCVHPNRKAERALVSSRRFDQDQASNV